MKKLIYVVDDDPTCLAMCSKSLEKKIEVEVKTFPDGETFLKALSEKTPDLVILDILMPGLSGFDVLEIVRENKSSVDLPVMMLTSESDNKSIVRALNLGANDYICKPVDTTVLAARTMNFLKMKELVEISMSAMEFEVVNRMLASYNQQMRDVLKQAHHHMNGLIEKKEYCNDSVSGLKDYLTQFCELTGKVQEIVEEESIQENEK